MRKIIKLHLSVAACIAAIMIGGCASSIKPPQPAAVPKFTHRINIKPVWSTNIGRPSNYALGPTVIGETVVTVAASSAGTSLLSSLNAVTGKIVWQTKILAEISTSPGSNGSVIAVATLSGKIFILDGTGRHLWQQNIIGEVLTAPLVTEKLIIVRTLDNRIYAFDIKNGKQQWLYQRAQAPLVLRASLGMIADNDSLIAGFPGGKIGLLNLDNGAFLWEATLTLAHGASEVERLIDVTGRPAIRDNMVCAAAFQGKLGCFNLLNGELIWSAQFSGTSGVIMDPKNLYAIDTQAIVSSFSANDGTVAWSNKQLQWRTLSAPRLIDGAIVFGDSKGELYILSTKDGSFLAQLKTGNSAITAAPVVTGKILMVQTHNGYIHGYLQQ